MCSLTHLTLHRVYKSMAISAPERVTRYYALEKVTGLPKEQPRMTYFANLPDLCLFCTFSLWWLGTVPATGQPCGDIICAQLYTIGVYLMTTVSFPSGMLVPILYVSVMCTVVCAILVSFCLHCGCVLNVYIQSRLLLGWVCSLLS